MALIGLRVDSDGYVLRQEPPSILARRLGTRFAILYLLPLVVLHVLSLSSYPQFGPASNVEESAYTYTSARNFVRFGFLNSGFLQDFSNSPYTEDHPYTYTHMPAGPDIVTAVLLSLTEFDYRLTRLVFCILFLLGIWCYVRVTDYILAGFGLAGGAFVLFFIWPWHVLQGMERLIYSPFLLLAFAPMLVVHFAEQSQTRNKRTWFYFLASSVAFAASLYLEYSLLSGVMAFWLLIYGLRVLPGGRAAQLALVASAILGILAHLVQNYLFMGHDVFLKELVSVLGNRITGFPSQHSLESWYAQNALVHHGSRPISPTTLLSQVRDNFAVFGFKTLVVVCAIAILATVTVIVKGAKEIVFVPSDRTKAAGKRFLGLLTSVTVAVLTPMVLFPAFAQEVSLKGSGANGYFLAIFALAATAFAAQQAAAYFSLEQTTLVLRVHTTPPDRGAMLMTGAGTATPVFHATLAFLLGLMLVYLLLTIARQRLVEYVQVVDSYRTSTVHHLEKLTDYRNRIFMTNVNLPVVGFLVEYPGFGVCSPKSVTIDGMINVSSCKVSFVRRVEYWRSRAPDVFVFFKDRRFFPAFADCLPTSGAPSSGRDPESCMREFESRLARLFNVLQDNELFTVFDLSNIAPAKNESAGR